MGASKCVMASGGVRDSWTTTEKNAAMSKQPEEQFEQQSLVEHLTDLRRCLVGILIAAAVGFVISYAFVDRLGEWLLEPLRQVLPAKTTLIFTSYQEGFFFI